MARLERVNGRTELVTDDGLRMPWELGEKPEYGLTLPPLGPPQQASLFNPELGATAEAPAQQGRRNVTKADIDKAAGERAVKAKQEEEQAKRVAALPQPPSGGRRNVTQADIQQAEAARNAKKEAEAPPEAKAEKKGLRGGLQEVDAPEVGDEELAQGPRHAPVQRIPGGLRTDTLQITRGIGQPAQAGLRESGERASIANREALAAGGAAEFAKQASMAEELELQAQGLQESINAGRERLASTQLLIDSEKAELDNERGKIQALEADPYRYWASKGVGTKILAAIGMLGGGLLQGLHGGENQFMKLVQNTMAEDKAERMNRIKVRERGFKLREGEWEKKREKLGTDIADVETEGRQLASVAAQLRTYARTAGVNNQALAAKVEAEAAKYDAESLLKYAEVDSKYGDKIVESIRNVPDQFVGGAPKVKDSDVHQLSADEEKAGMGEQLANIDALEEFAAGLPKEGAPTLETRNVASRGARAALDFVGGAGTGAAAFDSDAERRSVRQYEIFQGKARKLASGTAVSAQEAEKLVRQADMINTPEGAREFINELRRNSEARRAGIRAGAPVGTVEELERRREIYQPKARPKSSRGE